MYLNFAGQRRVAAEELGSTSHPMATARPSAHPHTALRCGRPSARRGCILRPAAVATQAQPSGQTDRAVELVIVREPIAATAFGSPTAISSLSRQLQLKARRVDHVTHIIASQIVLGSGPHLWLRGFEDLYALASYCTSTGSVLVERPGSGARPAGSQTVLLPRSCARDDKLAFVGFRSDLGLAQRLQELHDAGECEPGLEEAFAALYRAASLLQANVQDTPNFMNKLGPAWASIFGDLLLPSTQEALRGALLEPAPAVGQRATQEQQGGSQDYVKPWGRIWHGRS